MPFTNVSTSTPTPTVNQPENQQPLRDRDEQIRRLNSRIQDKDNEISLLRINMRVKEEYITRLENDIKTMREREGIEQILSLKLKRIQKIISE